MALWLIRAGKHGERESMALDFGFSVIGWDDLPDMAGIQRREQLKELMRRTYPSLSEKQISNYAGQIWAFRNRAKVGDLVVLPLKTRALVAVGRLTGDYQYRADLPEGARHTRPTEWLRTDLPRKAFGQDLLNSFGAFMTVCQIKRHDAEERVKALISSIPDPQVSTNGNLTIEDNEAPLDLEGTARDQIMDHISRRFRNHELARLVNDVLIAQGYSTALAAPGADGGADILAGSGPMGFGAPKLCVQVKSSDSPTDVVTLRDLRGTMESFGAEQGLLVSLGGFKSTVLSEARRAYFQVRLWDASDLVENLLQNYERLDPEVQALLPLKRIWTLVQEE